jgi:hypothetical protein
MKFLSKSSRKSIRRHITRLQFRAQPNILLKLLPTKESDVVVTMTSFPARFRHLHLVIQSLLYQTVAAKKIILYLNKEELSGHSIPYSLSCLQNEKFQILTTSENFRPYNKLVHALKAEPQSTLITVDDDRMYGRNLVAKLLEAHQAHPRHIICGLGKRIHFTEAGYSTPYAQWRPTERSIGYDILPLGYSGVLHPPHSLSSDTTRDDLFMSLAPTTDDLWFRVMSLLSGTPVVALGLSKKHFTPVGAEGPALSDHNRNGVNDVNWRRLVEHYQLNKLLSPSPQQRGLRP